MSAKDIEKFWKSRAFLAFGLFKAKNKLFKYDESQLNTHRYGDIGKFIDEFYTKRKSNYNKVTSYEQWLHEYLETGRSDQSQRLEESVQMANHTTTLDDEVIGAQMEDFIDPIDLDAGYEAVRDNPDLIEKQISTAELQLIDRLRNDYDGSQASFLTERSRLHKLLNLRGQQQASQYIVNHGGKPSQHLQSSRQAIHLETANSSTTQDLMSTVNNAVSRDIGQAVSVGVNTTHEVNRSHVGVQNIAAELMRELQKQHTQKFPPGAPQPKGQKPVATPVVLPQRGKDGTRIVVINNADDDEDLATKTTKSYQNFAKASDRAQEIRTNPAATANLQIFPGVKPRQALRELAAKTQQPNPTNTIVADDIDEDDDPFEAIKKTTKRVPVKVLKRKSGWFANDDDDDNDGEDDARAPVTPIKKRTATVALDDDDQESARSNALQRQKTKFPGGKEPRTFDKDPKTGLVLPQSPARQFFEAHSSASEEAESLAEELYKSFRSDATNWADALSSPYKGGSAYNVELDKSIREEQKKFADLFYELEQTKDAHAREIANLKAERDGLLKPQSSAEIESIRKDLETAKTQVVESQKSIRDAQVDNQKLQETIAHLGLTRRVQDQAIADLQKEKASIHNRLLASVTKQSDAEEKLRQLHLETSEAQKQTLRQDLDESRQALDAAKANTDELESAYDEIIDELSKSNKATEELNNKYNSAREAIKAKEAENEAVTRRYNALEQEKAALEAKIGELTTTHAPKAQLQDAEDSALARLAANEKTLKDITVVNEHATQRIKELEAQQQELITQGAEKTGIISELQTEIETVRHITNKYLQHLLKDGESNDRTTLEIWRQTEKNVSHPKLPLATGLSAMGPKEKITAHVLALARFQRALNNTQREHYELLLRQERAKQIQHVRKTRETNQSRIQSTSVISVDSSDDGKVDGPIGTSSPNVPIGNGPSPTGELPLTILDDSSFGDADTDEPEVDMTTTFAPKPPNALQRAYTTAIAAVPRASSVAGGAIAHGVGVAGNAILTGASVAGSATLQGLKTGAAVAGQGGLAGAGLLGRGLKAGVSAVGEAASNLKDRYTKTNEVEKQIIDEQIKTQTKRDEETSSRAHEIRSAADSLAQRLLQQLAQKSTPQTIHKPPGHIPPGFADPPKSTPFRNTPNIKRPLSAKRSEDADTFVTPQRDQTIPKTPKSEASNLFFTPGRDSFAAPFSPGGFGDAGPATPPNSNRPRIQPVNTTAGDALMQTLDPKQLRAGYASSKAALLKEYGAQHTELSKFYEDSSPVAPSATDLSSLAPGKLTNFFRSKPLIAKGEKPKTFGDSMKQNNFTNEKGASFIPGPQHQPPIYSGRLFGADSENPAVKTITKDIQDSAKIRQREIDPYHQNPLTLRHYLHQSLLADDRRSYPYTSNGGESQAAPLMRNSATTMVTPADINSLRDIGILSQNGIASTQRKALGDLNSLRSNDVNLSNQTSPFSTDTKHTGLRLFQAAQSAQQYVPNRGRPLTSIDFEPAGINDDANRVAGELVNGNTSEWYPLDGVARSARPDLPDWQTATLDRVEGSNVLYRLRHGLPPEKDWLPSLAKSEALFFNAVARHKGITQQHIRFLTSNTTNLLEAQRQILQQEQFFTELSPSAEQQAFVEEIYHFRKLVEQGISDPETKKLYDQIFPTAVDQLLFRGQALEHHRRAKVLNPAL